MFFPPNPTQTINPQVLSIGHGPAGPPKFNIGDRVVVVKPAPDTTTTSTNPASSAASPSLSAASRLQGKLVPGSLWKISSINPPSSPSSSSAVEHMYELDPITFEHAKAFESQLIHIRFFPGDIVRVDDILYEVEEVQVGKGSSGEAELRYRGKDELGLHRVLEDQDMVEGDKEEWVDFSF